MGGLYRSAALRPAATMQEVFAKLQAVDCPQLDHAVATQHGFVTRLADPIQHHGGNWELAEFFDKGYVAVSDCQFAQPRTEHVPGEDVIELHFTLTGPASVASRAGKAEAVDLSVIICRVGQQASYTVTCPAGQRRAVTLFIKLDFFLRLLDDGSRVLAQVHHEVLQLAPNDIYLCRLAINRDMLTLAESIVNNPHQGARRLLFLEAKCMELLCETIDTWRHAQTGDASRLWLRPRDMALIQRAATYVDEHLPENLTIRQLALAVGTNTSKLTLGFRVLLGMTVQQYTLKRRMERALQMLVEEQRSVSDTALAVGYQHASSFSLAFARHFGFAPSRAGALDSSAPETTAVSLAAQPCQIARGQTCR